MSYPVRDLVHGPSGHPGELPAPVVLVVDSVGHLLQVLEVGPDQHVAQRDEVTVIQGFDLRKEKK